MRGRRGRLRAGFTLIEAMVVVALVGILGALGVAGARSLTQDQEPERIVRSLLWELTVARTFAIRAGDPVSLVVDRSNRRLITRNRFNEQYRLTPFDRSEGTSVTSLSTNLAGDSLAFSARGYCTNCAAAGASPSTVTVVSRGRTYSMTINRLGRIQLVGQPAN